MATDWSDRNQDLRELGLRSRAIHHGIYTPLSELVTEAWVTREPVPFERRTEGRHAHLKQGDSWGRLWDCAWFHFTGRVPDDAGGKKIVLLIDFSGEGAVFDESGSPILGLTTVSSEFDRSLGLPGKRVVPLFDNASGGECVDIWVDAGCNDLFGGYRNEGRLRQACIASDSVVIRQLFYDFAVLLDLAEVLPSQSARRARVVRALRCASNQLGDLTGEEACRARAILAAELSKSGGSPSLVVSAIGQAHIDLAWLWPIRETIRKGARTFSTALALMDRYPDYVFGASQPQLYQWMKEHYPQLFGRIKERVAEGRLEAQGAMWVEADVNLSGGESLVRQLLYGKRFYKNELGVEAETSWLPDDFGFPASLPQVLTKSGIKKFLTTKLSWNTVNRFPRTSFWWEGIDGSRVLAHIPPEGNYNSSALPHAVRNVEAKHADKDISEHAMLLFGIGDGGGGPGEEHLERLVRERNLSGLPPVVQESAGAFFNRLSNDGSRLRTWSGGLYLERHQGTFTTQARSKRYNRKLEIGLRELEWTASMASVVSGYAYPGKALERIWKEVLLYQFHDILPGSSITRVYDESLARYDLLSAQVEELITAARQALTRSLPAEGMKQPVLVTNSLPWRREDWIQIGGRWLKASVPPMGYTVVEIGEATPLPETISASPGCLENEKLRVEISTDGAISLCFDKEHGREVLAGAGNILTLYDDPGDAWDFPPDYQDRPQTRLRPIQMTTFADGPRAVAHHRYATRDSRLDQWIILQAGSRRLDFVTAVDWNETHRMLRTSFPTVIRADRATCGIQFGTQDVPTSRSSDWDMARDEVCAHGWVDVSQPDYGVGLLDDCKYGHRVAGGVLDLNLLRSPTDPDPTADLGHHDFTYTLYPHEGDAVWGGVARAAQELNVPLGITSIPPGNAGKMPQTFSFLELSEEGVMVEAVKLAEDSEDIVVRLYEVRGASTRLDLTAGFDIKSAGLMNLVEVPVGALEIRGNSVSLAFQPFEIQTLFLRPG